MWGKGGGRLRGSWIHGVGMAGRKGGEERGAHPGWGEGGGSAPWCSWCVCAVGGGAARTGAGRLSRLPPRRMRYAGRVSYWQLAGWLCRGRGAGGVGGGEEGRMLQPRLRQPACRSQGGGRDGQTEPRQGADRAKDEASLARISGDRQTGCVCLAAVVTAQPAGHLL